MYYSPTKRRQIEDCLNILSQEAMLRASQLSVSQTAMRLQSRCRAQKIVLSLDDAIHFVTVWQRRQQRQLRGRKTWRWWPWH